MPVWMDKFMPIAILLVVVNRLARLPKVEGVEHSSVPSASGVQLASAWFDLRISTWAGTTSRSASMRSGTSTSTAHR